MLCERSPFWRRVARTLGVSLFRLAENNGDSRATHNGEEWLLRNLLARHVARAKRPFVVFDVGANVGDYTELVRKIARKEECVVEVHAFEPAPVNVARLKERFAMHPEVVVVPEAIGDRTGMVSLYGGRLGSELASLVPRDILGAGLTDPTSVPLSRLDNYLREARVHGVDFLKVDVEGFELAALTGIGTALRAHLIDVIQFEYGGTTLDAGVTLKQIFELLTSAGYRTAKLFPRSMELRNYSVELEHYAYANYVALSPTWLASQR